MTLTALLQNKLIELPKNWKHEGYLSYHTAVAKIGVDYINLLRELDEDQISGHQPILGVIDKDSLVKLSTSTFQAVNNCIRTYLDKGDPHAAYEEFQKRFSSHANPKEISPVSALSFTELDRVHYRLRESAEKISDSSGLFHVPFEKRHLIASYRYSIPGYPTLYLSNSVYLAFKELKEPDYDNLYAGKFFLNENPDRPQLLDLTYQPNIASSDMLNLYLYLARWPLLMACSFKAAFPEDSFKVEYVLPQIVFLWVKKNIRIGHNNKVIGVRYSSSKIMYNLNHKGYFYNTAIPVQSASETGYCQQLRGLFKMTKPISVIEALKFDANILEPMQVETIDGNGVSIKYINTDFGKIEFVLNGERLHIINAPPWV